MCAKPPTTFTNVWVIDPVNGFTMSEYATGTGTNIAGATAPTVTAIGGASGQGTAAHPWSSEQAVFGVKTSGIFGPVAGYSAPLLSTVVEGTGGGTGPIHPGDEVLLMTGAAAQYGAIAIGDFNLEINNSAGFVTFAAAPGQTPTLASLTMANVTKLAWQRIAVQSQQAGPLISVTDGNGSIPANFHTHDIVFNQMTVSSITDASVWTTQAEWLSNASQGPKFARSAPGGTYCITLTNSHMFNVLNAFTYGSDNSTVTGNSFDHFGDDGVDFQADNIIFRFNSITDTVNDGDGAHIDFMQGFTASSSYHDIWLDSNTLIWQTDPNLPFTTLTENVNGGIDLTDEDWTRWVVTNNVIAVHNHGISFGSCHDCLIAGNTVIDANITFNPTTHQGRPNTNVVVRNNLTTLISDNDPNVTVDHNVMIDQGGAYGNNSLYFGGVQQFFNSASSYAAWGGPVNGNIMDSGGGILSEIAAFDPVTTFTYDFHLLSSAPARGAGSNTTPGPVKDLAGVFRAPTHDAGAYVFH